MKRNYLLLSFYFIFALCDECVSQFVTPEAYYTFDEVNPVKSSLGLKQLDPAYYQCPFIARPSQVNKCADFTAGNCIVVSNIFSNAKPKSVAVEFLFKGKGLQFLSFPKQTFNITINESLIYFFTSSFNNGKSSFDEMSVSYTGKGKSSYYYLSDGNWHHLAFIVDLELQRKEIWIDGELLPEYSKKVNKAEYLEFPEMDGFKGAEYLDEVAFYTKSISGKQIAQHYAEFTNGSHYTFSEKYVKSKAVPKGLSTGNVEISGGYDVKEFAPGYPEYSIQALDQLRSFPLPRFKKGVNLFRNFPWTDITYLHRELSGNGGKGFGRSNPIKAVELADEMARYWNYYLEVPCLRVDGKTSNERYRNPNFIEGALVAHANSHPEFQVATIIMQIQNHPSDIGIKHEGSFVNSQNLPDRYYLRDSKGQVIVADNKKWLSPLMPLDIIKKDAEISRFYLSQLIKYLKRPIDIINENGEVFGNIRSEKLWLLDPAVSKHKNTLGLNNYQYNGYFQNILDSTYKVEVLKLPELKNTKFTFYNTSAVQAAYWPDYLTRRNLNSTFDKLHYPTPDFYPAYPDNWRNARGSLNGYGTIAQGRKIEISLGDKLFSPFVSAGWDKEEKNIRPAQWLALLKSMVMLGADFFYTGYFNVTGSDGKWPDGQGPNDPRGYIYQIAMPSYAQAISSYCRQFLTEGVLINPALNSDIERQFRFKGNNDNELILVRKFGDRYLIYGSIQTTSNFAGAVPNEVKTSINLNNKKVNFKIRRQGSVYIYYEKDGFPIFYQLDAWHQYEHPFYWSKDIQLEAELANKYTELNLLTENEAAIDNDFSTFSTGVLLKGKKNEESNIEWLFTSRKEDIVSCVVKFKSKIDASAFRICVNGKQYEKQVVSNDNEWKTINIPLNNVLTGRENLIQLEVLSGEIIVDWISMKSR